MKACRSLFLLGLFSPFCLADPLLLILSQQVFQVAADPTVSASPFTQLVTTTNGTYADMKWSSTIVAPYESAGKNTPTARIEADGYDSAEFPIALVPVEVGLLTSDGERAVAVNQDGQLPGSVVASFAVGQCA